MLCDNRSSIGSDNIHVVFALSDSSLLATAFFYSLQMSLHIVSASLSELESTFLHLIMPLHLCRQRRIGSSGAALCRRYALDGVHNLHLSH